jgi:hypothetical protein
MSKELLLQRCYPNNPLYGLWLWYKLHNTENFNRVNKYSILCANTEMLNKGAKYHVNRLDGKNSSKNIYCNTEKFEQI